MKKIFLLLIFTFLFPFSFTFAEINAGFVQGIWFSHLPFFTNETVTIYTAFQNNSGSQVSGKVEFKDNESVIGSVDFSAQNGELIDASLEWKATNGNHTFAASLIEVKNESGETIEITSNLASSTSIFADNDTDGDRIGDKNDPEDNRVQEEKSESNSNNKDRAISIVKNTHQNIGEVLGSFSEKVDLKITELEEEIAEESSDEKSETVETATTTEPAKNIKTLTLTLKKTELPLLKGVSYILKNQILFYFTTVLLIFIIIWIGMKITRRKD